MQRALAVGLSCAVVLTAALALPARVAAADPWSREVRFGESPTTEPEPILLSMAAEATGGTACNSENRWGTSFGHFDSYSMVNAFDGNPATFYHSGTAANSGWNMVFRGDDDFIGEPKTHIRIVSSNMAVITLAYFDPVADPVGWYDVTTFGSSNVNGPGVDTGIVDIRPGAGKLIENAIPDHVVCFRLTQTLNTADPAYGVNLHELQLYSSEELPGGNDCNGIPGAGTDDGLVIPAEGLVILGSQDAWGDELIPGGDGCLFTSWGMYRYTPPEGMDEGDTHVVAVEIGSSGGNECHVLIQINGSASAVNVINWRYTGGGTGAAGAGAQNRNVNVPPGGTHFTIYFSDSCVLYGLWLANVEGDPILDNGQDGTGDGDLGIANPWEDCEPGSDFLAVGEWVAYAACLIAGLPSAIAQLIGSLLADLFVPRHVGQAWEDFMATINGKVPFVWIGELVTVIGGLVTPQALAGDDITASMDLLGAEVTIDYAQVFGPVAQFRPILAGLVAIGTAFHIFRSLHVGTEPKQLSMGL